MPNQLTRKSITLTDSAIKHFVRNTLGCTCPEEVFESIESKPFGNASISLNIGGKLLVHVVNTDSDGITADQINKLIIKGVEERDACNFNRYRLVLVADDGCKIEAAASQAFRESSAYDEKTHLHVIDQRNSPFVDTTSGVRA